jgi:mandelate racemase
MPTTIREIRVRALRVPMSEPHRTASGVVTDSPLVLVDLVTSDGITGHGIIFTYTAAALRPTAELTQNLGGLITGEPLAPIAVTDKLTARFRLLGAQGLVGMAIAGLDMAMWDALARTHNLSLTRLLGAVERPLPAYGAVGYDGIEGSAKVAEQWAKLGFKGIKAKIGYPTVDEDIAVIETMRQAVGNGMSIMVDYNQSLTPTAAIERLQRLEPFQLGWIEEPSLSHDFAGHAQIAAAIQTPIQAGENWWGPLDFRQALHTRSTDYWMPEVMKAGGVTGWRRIASTAESEGIRVSTHLWPEVSAQLLCTTPMAHWLEYADWWHAIIQNPIQVRDGMAQTSTEPGSGFTWNEAAISRCLA